jgi:hypothetical protein
MFGKEHKEVEMQQRVCGLDNGARAVMNWHQV